MIDYAEFLASKRITAQPCGLTVRRNELDPALFQWQADIVAWALRRGRAALFEDCGLGKTLQQIEWAQQVSIATNAPVLILAPLAVAEQTAREGLKFGITVSVCESMSDVQPGANVTNYEKIHKFTPHFAGLVLDESSILKSFDGKTRKQITDFCVDIPYRLACTATPAPNDYTELGNHAEFLGVMKMSEMLATFFVHDGGDTSKWRLKGHAEAEFWRWVASWAVVMRTPSDLGYSDDGYILPSLNLHQLTVPSAPGEGALFVQEASTLQERNGARRDSIAERVALCADLVNKSTEQFVIWCNLNDESSALAKAIPDAVEVRGSDSDEHKKRAMADFTEGSARVIVTKCSISGWGMNWQHCARQAFVGLSDSWEAFYQGVRRCWRFGQARPVEAYVITSEREGAVVRNIQRKEKQAAKMISELVEHMKDINRANVRGVEREEVTYERDVRSGERWTAYLGDSVEVIREMEAGFIDYMIYSPPFASLYTYSNSNRDMGNVRDYGEFFAQYRFLLAELYRTLKPGRLLSFHCFVIPTMKERDGVIGLRDFRGDLIRAHQDAGFIFHSEVCIWKDPVTAMQRTKALGLLYKQLRKDSAMSRQGVPDYLVTMRKPGINPDPVTKQAEDFPCALWQKYASPVWMDINPSDTLQRESAREEKDERHICPLQLEVIERAIRLWTNPGDLVLSPFGGIGSEGYVALKMERRAIVCELKRSYWEQACRNLQSASLERPQTSLFAPIEDEQAPHLDEWCAALGACDLMAEEALERAEERG